MYTQCPECGTVFRLSADTLRVAQGDVRCGVCSTVFNALESLSDSPGSHLAHQPPPEDTMTVEEVTGSEIIELGQQGEALPRPASPGDEQDWSTEAATGPSPLPDFTALPADEADEHDAIEVSIADDEVARMLEASGTWERLRVDFKAPALAPPAAAEDGQPAATAAATAVGPESPAEAAAGPITRIAPAALRAMLEESEQVTLESGPDADTLARTPGPAEAFTEAVAELEPAVAAHLPAAAPATPAALTVEAADDALAATPPPAALEPPPAAAEPETLPAPEASPEPVPEAASGPDAAGTPAPDAPAEPDLGISWIDDDLDEAAVTMREKQIEELAEAIATGRYPVIKEAPAGTAAASGAAPEADADASDAGEVVLSSRQVEALIAQAAAEAAEAPAPAEAVTQVADELALPVHVPPLDLDVIWRQEPTVLPPIEPATPAPAPPPPAAATAAATLPAVAAADSTAAAPAAAPPTAAPRIDLDATDEFPILVLDESDDLGAISSSGIVVEEGPLPEDVREAGAAAGLAWTLLPAEPAAAAAPAASAVGAVSAVSGDSGDSGGTGAAPTAPAADVPLQILIPPELRQPREPPPPFQASAEFDAALEAGPRARRWPWAVALALLAVLLAGQWLHVNRGPLAASPALGPWLTRAYAALGVRLEAPANLAAYELRQWGASSDAVARDRLRFRASIVNRAPHPQPYPLLRLSLQDRFGNLVGSRDAAPQEYLRGGAAPTAPMLPGQRVDAELVVMDPGAEAVGFELELCVALAGGGVRCAKDADAG